MPTTPTAAAPPLPRAAMAALARRLTGRLSWPGTPTSPAVSARRTGPALPPVAVLHARTAQDVVEGVRFAARHGLEVVEQAGGGEHRGARAGSLLVRTGDLAGCQVSPEGWVRVGAGASWQAVLSRAGAHGLAPVTGPSAAGPVADLTAGGGRGPVARTYGLAADRVRAVEVVTGDGVLRRATPDSETELFWGVRGGRGALGVVTALELDLLAVDQLLAGTLHFAGRDAAAVLQAWRGWAADLPPQATTSVALERPPAGPGTAESAGPGTAAPPSGDLTVAVRLAWTGDPDGGASVLAPLRACAALLRDDVAVRPYADLGALRPDLGELLPVREVQAVLEELPAAAVDAVLRRAGPGSGSAPLRVELRRLGGAVTRAPERPSAVCHRDAPYSLVCAGPDTASGAEQALLAAVRPWSLRPGAGRRGHRRPRAAGRGVRARRAGPAGRARRAVRPAPRPRRRPHAAGLTRARADRRGPRTQEGPPCIGRAARSGGNSVVPGSVVHGVSSRLLRPGRPGRRCPGGALHVDPDTYIDIASRSRAPSPAGQPLCGLLSYDNAGTPVGVPPAGLEGRATAGRGAPAR